MKQNPMDRRSKPYAVALPTDCNQHINKKYQLSAIYVSQPSAIKIDVQQQTYVDMPEH